MDDDVVAALRAVGEHIKKLDAALKAEKDEREGLDGRFQSTDSQVDSIVASLGAWLRGSVSKKIDDIDSATDALKKRVDALEKKKK